MKKQCNHVIAFAESTNKRGKIPIYANGKNANNKRKIIVEFDRCPRCDKKLK